MPTSALLPDGLPLYQGRHARLRRVGAADLALLQQAMSLPGFCHYQPQCQTLYPDFASRLARFEWLSRIDPPIEMDILIESALTAEPVGLMSLSAIDLLNGKAEFAIYMHRAGRAFWEAWHYAMHTAFHHLGLYKLIFLVSAENTRVLALLDRLALRQEGVLQAEITTPEGKRLDLHRYAIDASEWPASRLHMHLLRLAPLNETPSHG
ncbi:GNAT family protein [Chitinimonas viridis]|uniref:GNAT family protein n=1 Tax=Chitinimonas viridis TaxID=664880 RepID=A0ABT8B5S8_9NEIS|nr:GNAT family protein [Chitinimonas viridis]MDN3577365.1 GNAT family protein [Chitinimonas viridis]